ncbi:hypothetical protein HanIR_Chr03g0145131 [Helianthus annuus]|nr:hypothetical protein HanIR_Chr03g0145131 [Helianthus annuus]
MGLFLNSYMYLHEINEKALNRGALGGELRHDSLTVVVYLYLRLDVATLPFRLVVNLYPNEP